jgi:hypothetical protein
MKLCISDLRAVRSLRAYLSSRLDYLVADEAPGTLRVGVLGSYRDGGEADLKLYVDAWRASHPNVDIAFVNEADSGRIRVLRSARVSFGPPEAAPLALAA